MILDENFFSSDWQERLQWNFLWGEEFKHHLVGWDRVCSPSTSGGWGFGNLLLLINLCWISGYGDFGWWGTNCGDK